MSNGEKIVLAIVVFIIALVLLYNFSPLFRADMNTHMHAVQKADDATRYETLKKVEDTCRAMIASYEADKLTWQQYKGSDSEEKRGWADQAMIRANRTAATYNTYILENSYVWADNVPEDIDEELPYLTGE